MNQILKETADIQYFSLSASGVRLSLILDPADPKIVGDADQIRQVFLHFIENAAQAMAAQPGDRCIEIRTRKIHKNAEIEFADSGPGIPPGLGDKILIRLMPPKMQARETGWACRFVWISSKSTTVIFVFLIKKAAAPALKPCFLSQPPEFPFQRATDRHYSHYLI